MMAPVRILVVDDSVVIRKLLTTVLSEVPELEVVATAAHGRIALGRIAQCNPDIVILDVEMPEMDGIETLKQIRKIAPRLPVIMFSTRTERGAVATIEALTCGASDYVAKPSNVGNVVVAMHRVREELVPKILVLTGRRLASAVSLTPPPNPYAPAGGGVTGAIRLPNTATTMSVPTVGRVPGLQASGTHALPVMHTMPMQTTPMHTPPAMPPAPPVVPPPPPAAASTSTSGPIATTTSSSPIPPVVTRGRPSEPPPSRRRGTTASPVLIAEGPIKLFRPVGPRSPVEIIAIGASTGGPNALSVLLGQLPPDFPVPIVIVQHMLATFTRHFADRLAAQCRIKIVEATAGDALVPGCVYIARGDHHLLVERRAGRAGLAMNQDPLENFCRPAVDVLFRSVARNYGSGALAVVLTGMGHDGLTGSGAIRDAGGDVIVQDEATSVVWGMPGFIARAGLASQVIAIEQFAAELRRRVAPGAHRGLEAAP